MSIFLNSEDGYFSLTTAGTIAVCVLIAVLLVLTAVWKLNPAKEAADDAAALSDSAKAVGKSGFSAKQLVFCAAALALGFATSYIRVFSMPFGGSVTLCSMLFVVLIGYWYGPKIGLTAGFAYGLLEFVQDGGSYILSPLQACMDYIFAFAALGLSGVFYQKKNGLLKGYLLAILVRGLFHTIGGYLYWMDYMPESFPKALSAVYPIVYNYSYILAEGILTIIVISLPPVKKALAKVKGMALS